MESGELLVNLVIVLVAGLAGATIAVRLRQSPIVGYIVAGIVVGPYTPGIVGDASTVEQVAEIGVILLMFTIGIQFSLRDLIDAGKVASIGATAQVALTIGAGTAVGLALGWGSVESIFFGAVISNSSSTVLSKVLGDRGELDSPYGKLALSWSAMQDIGTVILIVLLTALASDSDSLIQDLVVDVGIAAAFLLVLLPVGLKVLPRVFEEVTRLRSREVFVLTIAAIALGLAYGASFFGLSLALGAFIAGIVVGESDLSHQILGEVIPLRDLFAGVFFVSIGMLVDPGFVVDNLVLLLITVALIMFFKPIVSVAIASLLGTRTRTAILTGAILGQSAEFSFLLARVGQQLDAVSPTVFSLMLAGSAASIVLIPSVFRSSLPVAAKISARRPVLRTDSEIREQADIAEDIRGHAIICGYGRVGRVVGDVVSRRFRTVVIDEDPRVIDQLRAADRFGISGNAAIPAVLEQAHPGTARVLVVAIPDPVSSRQIVDYVRLNYPNLDVVVRTHSESERRFMIERGVNEVVLGEWELALEMTRHALHRFGVSSPETQALIGQMRAQVTRDDAVPR